MRLLLDSGWSDPGFRFLLRFIPITDAQVGFTRELDARCKAAGLRCSGDEHAVKMGAKIRRAQME